MIGVCCVSLPGRRIYGPMVFLTVQFLRAIELHLQQSIAVGPDMVAFGSVFRIGPCEYSPGPVLAGSSDDSLLLQFGIRLHFVLRSIWHIPPSTMHNKSTILFLIFGFRSLHLEYPTSGQI